MSDAQVTIPYVTVDRVIEILGVIYKKQTREISIEELASLLGSGQSSINNVTPTLGVLGLVKVNKRVITLTDDGLEFIGAYKSNKEDVCKRIVRKGVENYEPLVFVKDLLNTRQRISGEDIGRTLSSRYSKNWKNIVSIRTFGNSCASIIAFAGFGYYANGFLSLNPETIKSDYEFYPPQVGYYPMVRLLEVLYPFERAKTVDIASKLNAKESLIAAELAVCAMLGLVDRNASGGFNVSETGKKLIDPSSNADVKSQVFCNCLVHSPYKDIILRLQKNDESLTYELIGDILAHYLRRDWTVSSRQIYGKKFVTWLNGANILEKIGPNNFKIKDIKLPESPTGNIKTEDKSPPTTLGSPVFNNVSEAKTLFQLGYLMGVLEAIEPSEINQATFDNTLTIVRSMLKEYAELDLILELLKSNFALSLQTKNAAIYKANIEFTREKVKARLGMAV
jgi:Mn-dependent DtxR family transcriptional regulator/biotin operon repressor